MNVCILVQIFTFINLCSLDIEHSSKITTKCNYSDIFGIFAVLSDVLSHFNCIIFINIRRVLVHPWQIWLHFCIKQRKILELFTGLILKMCQIVCLAIYLSLIDTHIPTIFSSLKIDIIGKLPKIISKCLFWF